MADYTGGFDTTGDILLNFDITRTSKFSESFVIPPTRKYKLKYVPKDKSIASLGFTVVNTTDPQTNYIGVDYAPDNEYQAASGVVWFNAGDVGRLIQVQYIPIGSRIDANDLNPTLQWVHAYRNAVPTKTELATPTKARVSWGNIIDQPGAATPDATGFMSFQDKRALDVTDPTKKPVGGFTIGAAKLSPTVWGGNLELGKEGNVWPEFLNNKIIFRLDPATKGLVDDKTLAALAGTKGVPSASNKFVTEEDDRIKNPGVANHTHPITEVTNLRVELDSKSMVGHGHTTADISGLSTALSGVAQAGHKHAIADVTGLQPALDNKANSIHTHNDIVQLVKSKSDVGHNHLTGEIPDLHDYVLGMVQNNKQNAPSIDVRAASGNLANLSYVVKDGILSGMQTTITAGNTGSIDIAAGVAYAGGFRTDYPGGTVSCLAAGSPVKTVGAASQLGPVVVGEYPLTTPNKYTVVITKANGNPGLIMDLEFTITNIDGSKVVPVSYDATYNNKTVEERAVTLEPGFGIGFNMVAGAQYVVGDTWTITIGGSGYTHLYINGPGNCITKVATPTGQPNPPAVPGCLPIASVTVSNSSATAVVDRRGGVSSVVSLQKVYAVTQPEGDSSKKLATTEFVTQAITAAAAATDVSVITHNTVQIGRGTRLAAPPGTNLATATNVSLRVRGGSLIYWGFSHINFFRDGSGERIESSYAFFCDHATNQIVCLAVEGLTIDEVKIYVTGGK